MVYGCGNKCVKYLVFTFNFLVCVVGATILGVALAVRFSNDVQNYFQEILNNHSDARITVDQMYILLYVLAGIGAFLFFTGFLGCCGACCESVCLLALFFIIILILFVVELSCGIAILVKKNEFKRSMEAAVTGEMQKYPELPNNVKQAIDEMQQSLQCCGCKDASDFRTPTRPVSCPAVTARPKGCCVTVWENMEKHIGIVVGVAIGILVIELLAMIFSCILCQAFRRGDYQMA